MVTPTQKPVPSSELQDLLFNAGLLDKWATSLEREYIDRFGNGHLTAAGMEWLFNEMVQKFNINMDNAIRAAGYILLDSFQQGVNLPNNQITLRNQAVRDERTGEYYRWDGSLPKPVPINSTPESTDGIGQGKWVGVGDAALRGNVTSLEIINAAHIKNTAALSLFVGKMQRDEPVIVPTRGDSLTYGEASVTGTQAADPTTTQSGRVHTKKRASTTYPQALQAYLQDVFTGTVTVINQGYSGDNTKMGFADWNTSVGQHLTILMYGTNDAAAGFSTYQSIADYIYYYEKIILREIGFGSGVVIILPPQQKQLLSNTRLLDAYRSAARGLANKYGIPVIDGAEITRGFDSTPFDDNVHFKTEGYQKIAAAVSAFIIGKFDRDFSSASHGSVSSVRFDESPIKHKLGLFGIQPAKAAQKSPPLTSWTGGYVIETSTAGAKLKLAFYAETDDLIIQPSFTLVNATCSIVLDENVGQMQYELDDKFQENGITITSKPAASTSVSVVDGMIEYGRYAELSRQKATRIHVAQKGWHTLTMSIASNGSAGTMLMTVWGYSFQSADSVTSIDRTRFVRAGAQNPIGNVTPLYVGESYLDNSSGAFNWYKSVGTNVSSWVLDTAQAHQEGFGSPIGSAIPRKIGDDYLDKSPGAFTWYKSTGTGVDNWKPTTS